MRTVDAPFAAQPPRRAQLAAFRLELESVAGFDLDGRAALGDQASRRGWALATRSSSLASRVAFTVEAMPPPRRAISA